MNMEALLALDEVAQRTGQPVRRLRQWCATGSLRCERDGHGWLIPETEVPRVIVNAAERTLELRVAARERSLCRTPQWDQLISERRLPAAFNARSRRSP